MITAVGLLGAILGVPVVGAVFAVPRLGAVFAVPVDPDADQARDWLSRELAGADYQAARPTWFDRLSGAVADWFQSLRFSTDGAPSPLGIALVVLLVVVAAAVAFLVFGLPRLNRRSALATPLFGEDDIRGATALRASAEQAAAAGDYATAIAEMFRAIARGLAERSILVVTPGTTAHEAARRAASAFPSAAEHLEEAATAFDGVRYLGRQGTTLEYARLDALERDLRALRPVLEPVAASVPA